IYAGGAMMGFNEVNNFFRQISLARHLDTFGNVRNNDLCALYKGKTIVTIITCGLILNKAVRINYFSNIMIQCPRTNQGCVPADLVDSGLSKVGDLQRVLKGSGCFV